MIKEKYTTNATVASADFTKIGRVDMAAIGVMPFIQFYDMLTLEPVKPKDMVHLNAELGKLFKSVVIHRKKG